LCEDSLNAARAGAAADARQRAVLRQHDPAGARSCDLPDPEESGAIGLAINVYHVWWDPVLGEQLERAGGKGLLAFHSQIPCF